ncbi:FeoB1 [Clostridium fallax]|uniref:Ferrous iron transport protein B n=1 Tax=Clostridium fallax TaxID=1533 RepID=A0A1M4TWB3_9CLOT|nr:ferrous iron transport protein B [Clostridium fallax]SQB22361.1 FeoB1 [Clostridium fallax]
MQGRFKLLNKTDYNTNLNAGQNDYIINKKPDDYIIGLVGNPNTGKSTLFNLLTGLNQHTGNWPGKTVTSARGEFKLDDKNFILVDLPGCYSLFPCSLEEEVSRDFILKGNSDLIIVIVDGTCLERNLNLVLQIKDVKKEIILCVNLIDEAEKKNIKINKELLEKELGIPVVLTSARHNTGISDLKNKILDIVNKKVNYDNFINNKNFYLDEKENNNMKENLTKKYFKKAEEIKSISVIEGSSTLKKDMKIDNILTSKKFGIPIMILLLALIFWITIEGANYPSQMLSEFFIFLEDKLLILFNNLNAPTWLSGVLISGLFKTLGWVIAVMLPPMAIFFPLFTLLEDLGYLPRIAFNLDHLFKKSCAHGKQCLTMCMGFGCNAAGVVGCRIIESPRERIVAILTNNFVPCNGRFPTIIALSSIFVIALGYENVPSFFPPLAVTLIVVLGVIITLGTSYLLSKTLLKGVPSTFTLELPPYRKPKVLRILYTSLIDRTLFVLWRAVKIAAPAGIIIWILANIYIGDLNIIGHISSFLNPFAVLIGLDGVILLAFILGLPANEIVLPIILMSYLASGTLLEFDSINSLSQILLSQGWTALTALNTMLFSLLHWPCSTTLLTIKEETGSLKWTILSFLIPTVIGIVVCFLTTFIYNIFI